MKWFARLAAFALLALSIPASARVGGIEAESIDTFSGLAIALSAERSFATAAEDIHVQLTFANAGKSPLAVNRMYLPEGELDDPLFDISVDGRAVEYLGPIVKRGAPTAEDFVWLQPGESRTVTVELSGTYDLSAGGLYTIRYAAGTAQLLEKAGGRFGRLASNPVTIAIEGRGYSDVRSEAGYKAAGGGGITYTGRCSATQQSTLLNAVGAATTMADESKGYLLSNQKGTTRYTTWFGTYTAANGATALDHFTAISDAFNNKPLTLDCGCKKTYYAYVYPTKPYVIYVCKAFWTAPMTGTDSKGGTLIHEMSHFNVVAGTNDHVYGQAGAKSLASTDPIKALNNADNHEYFAENTPFQQ